jgi:hypothetical protein
MAGFEMLHSGRVENVSGWHNVKFSECWGAKYFITTRLKMLHDGRMRNVSRWKDAKCFRMTGFEELHACRM